MGTVKDTNPYVLFFSGGSALKETSAELARLGLHSVHVITTFDSGGSSAALRRAFGMPAVGDIRSRLLSLTDTTNPEAIRVRQLLDHRLCCDSDILLQQEFDSLVQGTHRLLQGILQKDVFRQSFAHFAALMPPDFPLQGASLGNLVLASEYLANGRNLGRAIRFVGNAVGAQGQVIAVTEAVAHLAVRLESGETIVGQHRFTGKESEAITSSVHSIWLVSEADTVPVTIMAETSLVALIKGAACIFFPMGSFYSSIIANLLVGGIREAIAAASCPKVFIPNPGPDPELFNQPLEAQLSCLLACLLGVPSLLPASPLCNCSSLISHMLVNKDAYYAGGIPALTLDRTGIALVEAHLGGTGHIEGSLLARQVARFSRFPERIPL